MMKRLVPICFAFLFLGIILGDPLAANGKVSQAIAVGVKQDSGGGFTNADLNGRYYFQRLGIHNFETNYREAEICYGYVDLNGTGSWTGQGSCFDTDGTTASIPSFNGTYSVNADGSFTLIFGESIDNGHFSSDINFGISSGGLTDNHGIHQGINTFLKAPDNPFVLSDINGSWQFRDLEFYNFEEVDRDANVCSGTIEINNSNWTADVSCFQSDGTKDTNTSSGTYTLTGNTFNFFEAGDSALLFSAYLSRDGNILTFSRGSSSGEEIRMFKGIALKKTTKTFTNADLFGTYFVHLIYMDDFETDDREAGIIRGAVAFDGNGNWTFTGKGFYSDGSSFSDGTGFGTYSVNPDGSFTFIDTSVSPYATSTGNISKDNNTIILNQGENIIDGWATINGTVTYNGTPLCAMVLANGQYMFSCNPDGEYQLSVPLDPNGKITLFVFVDGLAPFKVTSEPSSLPSDIEMQLASPDSKTPTVTYTAVASIGNSGWIDVAGFVSLEGTPLCAMVLANGQYMFSCDPDGEYQLSVPLDPNGEITLFVFVDSLQPYKEIIRP